MKGILGAHLNDLVSRAIEVYNRYRSPEATAKLVEVEKDGFIIEFEGPFCISCGVRDCFEGFIHELETVSGAFRVEVKDTEPAGPQSFRVQYGVKGDFSVAEVDEEALFRRVSSRKGVILQRVPCI